MLSASAAQSAAPPPAALQPLPKRMKIIDRYIGRTVIAAALTVLTVLLAIFTFFEFIDELEDIGRGSYDVGTALLVVALSMPRLAYDLFPIAALIGALLGLGALSERSEIAVVRAAGVSRLRIIGSVMKTALLFVLGAVLLGEGLYPPAERAARDLRTGAIEDRVSNRAGQGFWARDGQSFINIREVLPEHEFRGIDIYEFDQAGRLLSATRAAGARYADGRWELSDIGQTRLGADGTVSARRLARAPWNSVLDPDIIEMVAILPQTLSLPALARYVSFARSNGQNPQRWEHALWTKLAYPLASAVMVFLAIPLVLNASRSVGIGRRILVGAVIGLAFHVLNQASSHLGVVFGLPASVSALGPTLMLLACGVLLNYRSR